MNLHGEGKKVTLLLSEKRTSISWRLIALNRLLDKRSGPFQKGLTCDCHRWAVTSSGYETMNK